MTTLGFRNIKHVYDGKVVLEIPDLTIEPGSCVALVGSNGAGKSTLLEIAALLKSPTSGQVFIDGNEIHWKHIGNLRSKISFVAQEPYFFRGSLIRNMKFSLANGHLTKSEMAGRTEKYLDMVGVRHISNRSPRTYSGGELKRAAIARALCRETPVLILDEPFTSIDNPSAAVLEDVIRNLPDDRTVVFSTHELSRADRIADRIISLEGGSISPWAPDNLFRMIANPTGDGTELVSTEFRDGNLTMDRNLAIYYPGDLEDGTQHLVSLNANEVIVSREILQSSARNSFQGIVRQIKSLENRSLHLTVECSKNFRICAILTERAMKELKINVGDNVWVHFKSSAVFLHE